MSSKLAELGVQAGGAAILSTRHFPLIRSGRHHICTPRLLSSRSSSTKAAHDFSSVNAYLQGSNCSCHTLAVHACLGCLTRYNHTAMSFASHAGAGAGDQQHRCCSRTVHFLLVPTMAQGHTIPMTDMARLLAEHGAQISLVTTPVNAARMAGFVAAMGETGLPVQLLELPFPAAEFGLPDGCENVDMLQSKDDMRKFLEACGALWEPLTATLRQHQLPPSCIISDMMHWWTSDIARELGIPRLTFSGFCTFASLAR